jgi:alginate O-acetyltransferase complex protein AlgI
MVFSSIVFLFYFLAPVLAVYFLVPKRAKNVVLFAASLIFYSWGEPKYVFLMLFSALFNYASGLLIDRTQSRKKLFMVLNVVVNIGILVYFKYTNFMLSWVSAFFPNGLPAINVILPIGISFYTFQALSYTIDVYRGDTSVQKNFLSFGLYLSLFPQLIAGPIVRYDDVARQLDNRHTNGKMFMDGFSRFCAGLCKKVLIANSCGKIWTMISGYEFAAMPMSLAWLGIFAFAMQIYFDFSGYSDMAIGLGKIFGFDFLENFNYPYISKSVTEFWRRWHMSLGTWFREYVYIPLGGNRVSKSRWLFNILVVWMLTGLWHGAEWNYVAWGLYFGIILACEKLFLLKLLNKNKVIAFIYTVLAVGVSWALFAINDMTDVMRYICSMFNFTNIGIGNRDFLYNIQSFGILFIIALVTSLGLPKKLYSKILCGRLERVKYIFAAIGFIICTAYLVDDTYNPFLYFRF